MILTCFFQHDNLHILTLLLQQANSWAINEQLHFTTAKLKAATIQHEDIQSSYLANCQQLKQKLHTSTSGVALFMLQNKKGKSSKLVLTTDLNCGIPCLKLKFKTRGPASAKTQFLGLRLIPAPLSAINGQASVLNCSR